MASALYQAVLIKAKHIPKSDVHLQFTEEFGQWQTVYIKNFQQCLHRDIGTGFNSPILHTTKFVIPCEILMACISRTIMKRTLLILVLAISAIFLAGCSKSPRNLNGTVWVHNESSVTTSLTFTKVQCELKFASTTNPSDYYNYYYSYVYDSSTVMMYPESSEKAALKGIVNGNTMSVVNMSTEKTIGIFTKK